MPNALASATSPYLRQHADNPVNWLPWGPEAFARSREENKPIFLSVGYSSCHWCHVMAHESFEDAEVAELLNRHYIAVKVDREELPDVDEAYMTFVQMATGRGGWPMSVFLTPSGDPFFGGTYWPKDDRSNLPGFMTILAHMASVWQSRQDEVLAEGARNAAELRKVVGHVTPEAAELDLEQFQEAMRAQIAQFDPEEGGFGSAPKFPPHTALEFLMGYALAEPTPDEDRQSAIAMAFLTLEKICLGGIHDHVGGGFHRYSTDHRWLVPHFEKMLYDNALMLANLAEAARIAREIDPARGALFARSADGIVNWLAREMTTEDGLFASALDADSEGEEGAFYVWDYADLPPAVADAFGASPEGNYDDEATGEPTGKNILHLQTSLAMNLTPLLEARETRERPGRDDKALVGWNGLMIGALAQWDRPDLAVRAAEALQDVTARHGRLPHLVFGGEPQGEAYLEDTAALADGLFKLGDATGDRRWIDWAMELAADMVAKFKDRETGLFFASSTEHDAPFGRSRPLFDQPIPSVNALALRVLNHVGDEARATALIRGAASTMVRVPTATEGLYAAALPWLGADLGAEDVEVGLIRLERDGQGRILGQLRFGVAEGLHLNGPGSAEDRIPLWITVDGVDASLSGVPAELRGEVDVSFTVSDLGQPAVDLSVEYQACSESECQLPVRMSLTAQITDASRNP